MSSVTNLLNITKIQKPFSDFYNDVFKLLSKFPHNPFLLSELTVVNNTEHLFEKNEVSFIENRLITSKLSINATIELSPFFRKEITSCTFDEFAAKMFQYVMDEAIGYDRVDVICDRYFHHSLKNMTRAGRGERPMILFDGSTLIPNKFRESFLKNNDNKERLNMFLAEKFISLHRGESKLTITKGSSIVTNDTDLDANDNIRSNTAEEADQKIIRHMIDCVKAGIHRVAIRTVDTDVILSLVAYRHYAGSFDCKVYARLVSGKGSSFFDINQIAINLGEISQGIELEVIPNFPDIISIAFLSRGKREMEPGWASGS